MIEVDVLPPELEELAWPQPTMKDVLDVVTAMRGDISRLEERQAEIRSEMATRSELAKVREEMDASWSAPSAPSGFRSGWITFSCLQERTPHPRGLLDVRSDT